MIGIHDYSPLAVLGFVVLAIVGAVILMFVLAWSEATLSKSRPAVEAGHEKSRTTTTATSAVSFGRTVGSNPIMKMGRERLVVR
jgi:hypothetical protein